MRLSDWPERLVAATEAAESKEFNDVYYCVTFAADCVHAMTGDDPLAEYRGLSMEDALKKLKGNGYKGFNDYMVKHFGKPVPLSFAQRGDVVIRTEPELATGICLGENTAFASDVGLSILPTLEQRWCFKVR